MDVEFLKYLSTLGVGGLIAGLMFMVYRKDMAQYAAQWKGQSEALLQVVKENSAAITANTSTIQALHRRDDRIDEALNRIGFTFPHRLTPPEER
jgi:hypothetical protein